MGPEQTDERAAPAHSEGRQRFRQARLLVSRQALQRVHHRAGPCELRATAVSPKLAPAAEPHDDDRRQDAEHDLRSKHRDVVAEATTAIAPSSKSAVDDASN